MHTYLNPDVPVIWNLQRPHSVLARADLLVNAMSESGMTRFLIDGFPRKLDQLQEFEATVCVISLESHKWICGVSIP
jgi:hypothetical protein